MESSKLDRDFFKAIFIFALIMLSACGTSSVATPTATLPVPTKTTAKTPISTSTVTPSSTATPAFEGFGLSPELVKALNAHIGLQASLNKEASGQYTVIATILSSDSQPTTQSMYVVPSTLSEDLESKNKFGNTPTIQTADGKKLYWVQEEQGWFAVEISADINKPVFVPFDQRVIATRVIVTEFNQPFSKEAIDHWKASSALAMNFQYLNVNAKTGESTKFGYLANYSTSLPDTTKENTPVQFIDAWFTTTISDGTQFEYFPTKWFDPGNSKSPDPNEWKIIFCASGQEIMGIKENRIKFENLWVVADEGKSKLEIVPIFRDQKGFFNSTNNLITFGAAQPSLEKLIDIPENNMNNLPNPGFDETPYKVTFDYHFPNLSPTNASITVGISKDDPKYHGFFPSEIQTIIFPSMIISR